MEFGKFIRSLWPTFSRDQVQEDLDTIRDELDKYVLPVYQTAAKQIGREQFYSADAIAADRYSRDAGSREYPQRARCGA